MGSKVSGRWSEVLQAGGTRGPQRTAAELTFLSLATGKGVKYHSEGLSELPGHSQAGGILDKRKRGSFDHTFWKGRTPGGCWNSTRTARIPSGPR